MSGEEFMRIKNELRDRSKRMVEMGEKLLEAQDQGTLSRTDVRVFNDYKKAVYAIEKQWKITHEQLDQNSLVILWPIAKLISGSFWYVPVVLYDCVVDNDLLAFTNTLTLCVQPSRLYCIVRSCAPIHGDPSASTSTTKCCTRMARWTDE